jgi:hypothetical protein
MTTPVPPRSTHLRGAARLATDATAGLVGLVEAMHARIASVPGLPVRGERTSGITGLVYRSIHGVTRLVGGSVDALLALIEPELQASPPSAERAAVLAALNGVLGDHLAATHNPLATTMALRRGGQPLQLADAGPKLLLLVHGLCMNDLQWQRQGHDHGLALARDLGFTPVYLHYNSGRHISENGHDLALLLEDLLARWPVPLQRFAIVGHSMGGLVARSAVQQGAALGQRWPALLQDLVFLGTPHHGAPLERAGHGVDVLLDATPYAAPFARLGKLRSAGITDLRHGCLVEADWAGRDRFARGGPLPRALPLPEGVRCFAAAGHLGDAADALASRALGDGLVPLDSALGRHRSVARRLAFAEGRTWVGSRLGHLDLLSRADVYAQLQQWLADSAPLTPAG